MKDMNNELAAALAHEIKNPVAIIKANIDYLRLSMPKDFNSCFNAINKELNKLNTLINDYTAILQPRLNSEIIFLEDLIYDVTEEFNILSKREIMFTFDLDSEIKMMGDYKKLSIMLFNIYKNSAEAIEKGGKIHTRLYSEDKDIFIEISDTGKGVPQILIDSIGTPFMTTKEGGSGLGLMICQWAVEAHNGIMTIENTDCGCKTTVLFKKGLLK